MFTHVIQYIICYLLCTDITAGCISTGYIPVIIGHALLSQISNDILYLILADRITAASRQSHDPAVYTCQFIQICMQFLKILTIRFYRLINITIHVAVGMHAKGMTLLYNTPVLVIISFFTNYKECSLHSILIQNIQNLICIGTWSIIKCQIYLMNAGIRRGRP